MHNTQVTEKHTATLPQRCNINDEVRKTIHFVLRTSLLMLRQSKRVAVSLPVTWVLCTVRVRSLKTLPASRLRNMSAVCACCAFRGAVFMDSMLLTNAAQSPAT